MGGKRSMPAAPGHYPGPNALYFTKHYFTKTRPVGIPGDQSSETASRAAGNRSVIQQRRPVKCIQCIHNVLAIGVDAMRAEAIEIVDYGRGPQLSTTRISVLDIFYYLHRGYDFDTIQHIMPTLSRAEFDVVLQYVKTHHDELVEKD